MSDPRLYLKFHLANRALVNLVDAVMMEAVEVPSAQVAVMHLIAANPSSSPMDIAKVLNLQKSAVSGLLQRLEKRGLIERLDDPQDGRKTRLQLTADGEQSRAIAMEETERLNTEVVEGFSEEELAVVHRFLDHLVQTYGRYAPRPEQ